MLRTILVVCVVMMGALMINGCETTKGVAVGIGATAMGVGKDAKNTWHGVMKADDWIKKNLW